VLFVFGLLLVTFLMVGAPAAPASAHEDREVGDLLLDVGFVNEPAYEGMPNGVHLEIRRKVDEAEDHGDATHAGGSDEHVSGETTPVTGVSQDLDVEVTYLPTRVSRVMPLYEVGGSPGIYRADLVPTAPGQYRFRFFGTIDGHELNEVFESGPNTFSEVKTQADVQFPQAVGSLREVRAATRGAETASQDALSRASSASALGLVGIVVGAIGVATGAAGVALAARWRAQS
jgi:hypothetical protein